MGSAILETKIGELFLKYEEKTQDYIEKTGVNYIIPSYQRSYKWDKTLSEILFRDIVQPKGEGYNFGFITLSKVYSNNQSEFEVIDGQQRLTTVFIILLAMGYKLKQLEAGNSEMKRIEMFISEFPFSSLDSPTVPIIEEIFSNWKEINLENTIIDNPVYENFVNVIETMDTMMEDRDSNSSIGLIVSWLKVLLNQKIIVLKYDSPSLALDSFIALNMKGRPLDTFEIFSALCLKVIDNPKEMEEYKKKLNEVYNTYSLNSKTLGFSSFEHYLKSMIICMNYSDYVANKKKMGEINLNMPNHYIEQKYKTPTQVMNFIDSLKNFTEKILLFLKKGKIFESDFELKNRNINSQIQIRLQEIEFLVYGWNNRESNNILMVVRRYLYSLIIGINLIEDVNNHDDFIWKSLTEIVLSLYNTHLLSVIPSNYKALREENLIIKSAQELKKFYNKEFSTEEVFNKPIQKNPIVFTKPDFLKQSLIFQLNMKNNKVSISSPLVKKAIAFSECNLEHFFIDRNRNSTKMGMNGYLFNTLWIKKSINDYFAEREYKDYISKYKYLDESIFPTLKHEMEFVTFFIESFNKEFEKIKCKENKTKSEEVYIELMSDYSEKMDDDKYWCYVEITNVIMRIVLDEMTEKLRDILKSITSYENKCTVY